MRLGIPLQVTPHSLRPDKPLLVIIRPGDWIGLKKQTPAHRHHFEQNYGSGRRVRVAHELPPSCGRPMICCYEVKEKVWSIKTHFSPGFANGDAA